jgi:hypothetical protein
LTEGIYQIIKARKLTFELVDWTTFVAAFTVTSPLWNRVHPVAGLLITAPG